MTTVLTKRQMKDCDTYAIKKLGIPQETLMKNAAKALFEACIESGRAGKTVILCGKGNNGGDGYYLAAFLTERGYACSVIKVCESPYSAILKNTKLISYTDSKNEALAEIREATAVVDCIFGTGFSGEVPKEYASLFCAANEKFVIACDVPSGTDCDTGCVSKIHIRAKKTVTFCRKKPFTFLYPGKEAAGEIILADIGIPEEAVEAQSPYIKIITEDVLRLLPKRERNSHKGTFGKAGLAVGSEYMTGAAALCTKAALKSGVGLTVISAPENVRKILQTAIFEPIYVPPRTDTGFTAAVVGCGLGENADVTEYYIDKDAICVFDADALTYISKDPDILKRRPRSKTVITPHPGEMARLTSKTVAETEADRPSAALGFAKEYGVVTVLKGANTLIASPDGRLFVNETGNSGLAKGGSGDVLAGLIGGLAAQGIDPLTAALIGVYAHGKAADEAVKDSSERGILPSELPDHIAKILR